MIQTSFNIILWIIKWDDKITLIVFGIHEQLTILKKKCEREGGFIVHKYCIAVKIVPFI